MDVQIQKENIPRTYQYHWGWSAVLSLITIITVAVRYALPVRDGDLFFHMLYGKYFLDNKTLIADHTIFSWTPSTNDTIYCTWLPDIFFYLLHKWAGFPGIYAFQYFCLFIFVFACFLFSRRLGLSAHPLVWLIALIGVLLAYVAAYTKPEILSFVLMTLFVWTWFRIRIEGNENPLWCYYLPIIMVVWVNSHGAFVFGFIFLVCAALGELMNSKWSHGNILPNRVRKHLWIGIGLTLLTPLINPYGWRYPYQLFFDLLPTTENLAYNRKIASYIGTFVVDTQFHSFALYANIAAIIVVGLSILLLRKKKIDWSVLLPNIVFFYLYTMYFRTTYFLAPVSAFSSIFMLSFFEKHSAYTRKVMFRRCFPALVLIFCILISSHAIYKAYINPEVGNVLGEFEISSPNPVDEAEYIKKYFPGKKIGNTYNVGSYLLWKLWPENKIFLDSRHFPFKNWAEEYFAARKGVAVPEFFKKYQCDIWCVDYSEAIFTSALRNSPEWKLAFYGRSSQVYVKRDLKLPGNGQFQASDKMANIKSRYIAYQAFLFAINIYDWKTAEILISVIEDQRNYPGKKDTLRVTKELLVGMKAFAGQNYNEAIEILTKFNDNVAGIGGYIVTSHLHQSQMYLNKGQYKKALSHVQTAYSLLPNVFYTPYNLGLVEYLQDKERYTPNKYVLKLPKWKWLFREFINRVPDDLSFQKEVAFAKRVLAGEDVELKIEERQILIPQLINVN